MLAVVVAGQPFGLPNAERRFSGAYARGRQENIPLISLCRKFSQNSRDVLLGFTVRHSFIVPPPASIEGGPRYLVDEPCNSNGAAEMLLTNTDVVLSRGESSQLVVILHAWVSSSSSMADVRTTVVEAMPNADLLTPDYPASLLSNADPIDIADELVDVIRAAWDQRIAKGKAYAEIILIGYSLGALLVRKAFAFARGHDDDTHCGIQRAPQPWASAVTRIILLAGMNRGWAFHRGERGMSLPKWLGYQGIALLFAWLGIAKLINSVRRGAPFVANLRVQWIRLIGSSTPPPLTVQLLGQGDDVVSQDDNVDLQSGAEFIYKWLPDTAHADAASFSKGPGGAVRKRIFCEAMLTPANELIGDAIQKPERDVTIQDVVFVMHGIRDFGLWTESVAQQVSAQANAASRRVETITSGYGYFPMLNFLILGERQRNVRWFMDQYTEAMAKYPQARMSFIGHSNGTYLLASALQRYAACRFHRIVFAGSVVPTQFAWDEYRAVRRVAAVQNYVGSNDWVVAIFPKVFEQFRVGDLGSGGYDGFTNGTAHPHQIVYIRGGHGAAIVPENHAALAAFALGDDTVRPPNELVVKTRSAPL
ncbi:MAG TPA: hypothetical protein VGI81_26290, partial [Tepidisphaeraceae bacterium]